MSAAFQAGDRVSIDAGGLLPAGDYRVEAVWPRAADALYRCARISDGLVVVAFELRLRATAPDARAPVTR